MALPPLGLRARQVVDGLDDARVGLRRRVVLLLLVRLRRLMVVLVAHAGHVVDSLHNGY